MSNLKPCPFCESSNVEAQGIESFTVVCKECGANGPVVSGDHLTVERSINEAARLWNNHEEHEIAPLLKLEAEVKKFAMPLFRQHEVTHPDDLAFALSDFDKFIIHLAGIIGIDEWNYVDHEPKREY